MVLDRNPDLEGDTVILPANSFKIVNPPPRPVVPDREPKFPQPLDNTIGRQVSWNEGEEDEARRLLDW